MTYLVGTKISNVNYRYENNVALITMIVIHKGEARGVKRPAPPHPCPPSPPKKYLKLLNIPTYFRFFKCHYVSLTLKQSIIFK